MFSPVTPEEMQQAFEDWGDKFMGDGVYYRDVETADKKLKTVLDGSLCMECLAWWINQRIGPETASTAKVWEDEGERFRSYSDNEGFIITERLTWDKDQWDGRPWGMECKWVEVSVTKHLTEGEAFADSEAHFEALKTINHTVETTHESD